MNTSTTPGGCGCGCCAGVERQTPQRLGNRPGLAEVAYRTGNWEQFRQSMLAGLTRPGRPALAGLRTRDRADWAIALIDAWALAADVLTFHTERAANENYLGTATEPRSVAGIVGLIGYRPGPGVAAQTVLAFALDTSPGSPTVVPVVAGAKVQTLPGPGQVPQTFETVEDLTALAGWNELRARRSEPRVPKDGDEALLLEGGAIGAVRGDTLLFVGDTADAASGFATARVTAVAVDAERRVTTVRLSAFTGSLGAAGQVDVHLMRDRAALFGYNAASPVLFVTEVRDALGSQLTADDSEWAFGALDADAVDLDGVHEGLAEGSPVVLRAGDATALAHLVSVREVGRTAHGISAKVTRLALDVDDDDLASFGAGATRQTVLLLRSEPLTPAEAPITAPVWGGVIGLDVAVPVPEQLPRPVLLRGRRPRAGTKSGTSLVWDDGAVTSATGLALPVLGIRTDVEQPGSWVVRMAGPGGARGTLFTTPDDLVFSPPLADDPVVGETALVEGVDGATLLLAAPLAAAYDRVGLEIWGNVAVGTHGESVVDEVLGSGDAARPHQRFTLRRVLLTHTQAATPSGGESTLRVFVGDVQWAEVPSLFGRGPRDRVYTTSTTDDGRTVVQFGDGVSGARLPTGRDNVVARYRSGTGLAGLAAADQLSLLMTRPLGVRSVRNPLPAVGAREPEAAESAADSAPRTVLTLDRVVSLQDFADFARGFGGVGKAAAVRTWDGQARGVALTVAGIDGAAIDPADPLLADLAVALREAGDKDVPLVLLPARVGLVTLEARLVLEAGFQPQPVLDAARAALLDHFSFARRDFGRPITLSEVDLVLHAVRGVTGVFVTRLHLTGEAGVRNPFLAADAPVPGAPPPTVGAEVLALNPAGLALEVAP